MNFGEAIEAARKPGVRIARTGWNGKGMYVWLEPERTGHHDLSVR